MIADLQFFTKDNFIKHKDTLDLPESVYLDLISQKLSPSIEILEGFVLVNLTEFQSNSKKTNWLTKNDIYVCLSKDRLILITYAPTIDDSILSKCESEFKNVPNLDLGRVLCRVFELIIERNKKILFDIEKSLSELEDTIISSDTGMAVEQFANTELTPKKKHNPYKNYMDKIIRHRKQLFLMRKYIEPLDEIIDFLLESDLTFITSENRFYFQKIATKLDKLNNLLFQTREYATQVREAWQTQVDIGLNSIMKIFTVITAISLPISLVTGWYGMNFKYMPELNWTYGYAFAFLFSAIVVIFSLKYFKKNKLL